VGASGKGAAVDHVESRWAGLAGRLALASFATLLVLGAFEIALRLIGYEPIYRVYSHPEVFWQRDELLGWSHEPHARGTFVGPRPWPVEFEAPVEINSLGLRGPEPAPLPPDGLRVMVLGDSMVASFEVPWEQTFIARMQESLTAELGIPVQVINAGVRGYGADQSYLYYRERGAKLEPDLVVFIPSWNDLADNVTLHRMRRIFGKGALQPGDDGELRKVGYPIPEFPLCSEWLLDASFEPRRIDTGFERVVCAVQARLADRSALFTFVSLRIRQNPRMLEFLYRLGSPGHGAEQVRAAERSGEVRADDVAPGASLNLAILEALARDVRARGAELLVPVRGAFAPPLDEAALAAEGVHTFELDVDFEKPEYHYVHDSHLNARGHEVLAERLGAVIAERARAR
jgi:hypothetical protein